MAGMTMFVIGLVILTEPTFSQTALQSVKSGLEEAAKRAGITLVTSSFSVASIAFCFSVALIIFGIFLAVVSVLGFIGVSCGFKSALVVVSILIIIIVVVAVVIALSTTLLSATTLQSIKTIRIIKFFENLQGNYGCDFFQIKHIADFKSISRKI